jgi:hypothetical protein
VGVLLWAAFGVALLLLILALFSRGGAHETYPSRPGSPAPLPAGEIVKAARELLTALGFEIELVDARSSERTDILARDARPVVGGRVTARVFERADGEPVGAVDVQAAWDAARGDGFSKAILISATGFSHEAITAADGTAVELLDGHQVATLWRRHVGPSTGSGRAGVKDSDRTDRPLGSPQPSTS